MSHPRQFAGASAIVALLCLLALPASATDTSASAPGPATNKLSAAAKIFQAVRTGDLATLRSAIAEGGDVNGRDSDGFPALLVVLREARSPLTELQRDCVACLLEHGADVDAKDELARTPLIHAARVGDLETIKVLVDGEAYVKTRDRLHKTALFYAVDSNRPDIVRYLASHGDLVSLTIKERKLLEKH